MMYSNRFIASLKVGGKILRENSGAVSLPFGSEYEILLKNLNSRRAMCKVTIDGQDATEGTRLILPANGSLTLERFIKNNNLKAGNKFKFIERTRQIEDHRGIKEEDGLIRVEFWAEKEVIEQPIVRMKYYDNWVPVDRPYWPYNRPYYWYEAPPPYTGQPTIYCNSVQSGAMGVAQTTTTGSLTSSGNIASASGGMLRSTGLQAMNCSAPVNDAGITVAGSKSDQSFQSSYGFETEFNSQVIVLQLRGVVRDEPVKAAVTVDFKPTCPTCGKVNKISHQFCSNCGTNLHTS
jgi:hypothetical protein